VPFSRSADRLFKYRRKTGMEHSYIVKDMEYLIRLLLVCLIYWGR